MLAVNDFNCVLAPFSPSRFLDFLCVGGVFSVCVVVFHRSCAGLFWRSFFLSGKGGGEAECNSHKSSAHGWKRHEAPSSVGF